MTESSGRKSIARSLGEFIGHIAHGVRSRPEGAPDRREVNRVVEEQDQGDVILRRTVIDEVELKDPTRQEPSRHDDE
ncbi:MAG: hypothetical protein MK082_09805 [Phycisphaerales bacterium]|nr:hypothetical protein [Phycisphaerales bacterium]